VKAVCDTSVLIAFDTLGKKKILYEIFSNIIIPGGVQDELRVDLMGFVLEEWITVKKIRNIDLYRNLCLKLDEGESEAITLSLEEKPDYILLDDKDARKEAMSLGLNVIGTVGLLLLAKKRGFITSVKEEIIKLENRINFRLSEKLKQLIIDKAGE
jgi:predicted nucleic acid-binding protein